jgi:DNA replication and repair protein RecF
MAVWTAEFVRAAERLHDVRRPYFEQLVLAYETICKSSDDFRFGLDLKLSYSPGWDKTMSLSEALQRPTTQSREHETGLTQVGPHRADIRLLWHKMPAKEVLSRGQKKVLAYCLKLAQLQCLLAQGAPKPVILIDDIGAELDRPHLLALLKQLADFETQIFLTAIEKSQFPEQALWVKAAHVHEFYLHDGQLCGHGVGEKNG